MFASLTTLIVPLPHEFNSSTMKDVILPTSVEWSSKSHYISSNLNLNPQNNTIETNIQEP